MYNKFSYDLYSREGDGLDTVAGGADGRIVYRI